MSGRKAWHVSIDCPIRHSRGPSAAVSWGARVNVELPVDVPEVGLNRLAGDEEPVGDLAGRLSGSGEFGDPAFSWGERVSAMDHAAPGSGARGEQFGPRSDNEGVGGTTLRPGVLTITRMGDGVADFIKALHLRRPDVLGWSMGGEIAQALGVRHPALVRRLGATDSGFRTSPTGCTGSTGSSTAARRRRPDQEFGRGALTAV